MSQIVTTSPTQGDDGEQFLSNADLCAIRDLRGRKPGFAKACYKDKFKEWPPWSWDQLYDELKPIEPSPATLRWVQSQMIRYAKRRKTGTSHAKRPLPKQISNLSEVPS